MQIPTFAKLGAKNENTNATVEATRLRPTLEQERVAQENPSKPEAVVVTRGLTKRYGTLTAVEEMNLELHEGEIFGLLGPNGAGKTTLILMLMGLTEPTAGWVRVLGFDSVRQPIQVKRLVGYLPEHVAMYDDLSARANLMYTADLNGLTLKEAKRRIAAALERVGLADVADQPVATFSHGMRQRLGIADVLIKQPRLVILDEPTLGLDPEAVNQLLDLIADMNKENRLTVLLSSHQLHQVQRICSRVGIMVRGKLIAQGSMRQLAHDLAGDIHTLEVGASVNGDERGCDPRVGEALKAVPGVIHVEPEGAFWRVRATHDIRPALAKAITSHDWSLYHLRERDFGLEEIYLKYFQNSG